MSRDADLVAETLTAAPRVEATMPAPAMTVATPTVAPVAAAPCFDEDASARHGRVTGRVLGLCVKNVSGRPLDDDIETTAGEALGIAFSLLGRTGNRFAYVSALVGMVAVPLAATAYWWWRTEGAKDVTPGSER